MKQQTTFKTLIQLATCTFFFVFTATAQNNTFPTTGFAGIGTSSPTYKLTLTGTSTTNDTKIGINSTQVIYLPDQNNFMGSFAIGDGLQSLSHTSGSDGQKNSAFGLQALTANTTGWNNVATGNYALHFNTTGTDNVADGLYALYNNVNGLSNFAAGTSALQTNVSGNYNIAIGQSALTLNTSSYNVAIGALASTGNTTGNTNCAFGASSLRYNTTGSSNTALGTDAIGNLTTGSYNTAVGFNALLNNTNGSYNVIIGSSAALGSTTGDGNICIGTNANLPSNTGSSQLSIGNLIFGTGLSGSVTYPAGNLGIGTTTPGAKLEINSATTGTSGLKFTQLNSSSTAGTANNKALTVDASGNVILVPVAASDGSGTKVNTLLSYITVTGNGTTATPYLISTNGPWVASTLGTGNIINSNTGAVIIGASITSVPTGYSLYVSGGILTEKIKAALKTSANWADYVFNKNYKLKPLDEVKTYIDKNKHLPDMPSADELVKDGGIDMNEMFAKQMAKIEELTLYMIQLKKEVDELKKENADLKSSLSN